MELPLHKFMHINDLRFYLYRTVQNQCLNYIRDKKVEDSYRSKTEVTTEDYFYNALLEEEIFIRLRQAIDELPEKYRNVINLNLEGLSDKEIAEKVRDHDRCCETAKEEGKRTIEGKVNSPIFTFTDKFHLKFCHFLKGFVS